MRKKQLTSKSGRVKELTGKDIRAMRPASAVLPQSLLNVLPKRKRGERGPQKEPKKVLVTKRYEPDVLEYFKSTGRGWQGRIDTVLRDHMKKHPQNQEHSQRQRSTKHQKHSRA